MTELKLDQLREQVRGDLVTHGQEETLQAYGDGIIPQFSGVAA